MKKSVFTATSLASFKQSITKAAALLLLFFLVYGVVKFPNIIQKLDFLTTFYVAGHMVKEGRCAELYPEQKQKSFAKAPFDNYAHQILPYMTPETTTFFPYPPLIALLFKPFGYLSPITAFAVWEVLSILSLISCTMLISSLIDKRKRLSYFWYSLLYLPIFHILWIGQTDLVFLCFPLALGYFWFKKDQPVRAGLSWSFLLLKPQFIVIPILFLGSVLRARKVNCLISFISGMFVLSISNIFCFGPAIVYRWISSLKLNAAVLLDPSNCKISLMSSLHEAIMQFIPHTWQPTVNPILYLLEMAIFFHALLFCRRLVKNARGDYIAAVPFVFSVTVLVLPLILPYFRYYDLGVLGLLGIILFEIPLVKSDQSLMRDLLLFWIFVDFYMIFIVFANQFAQPLLLVIGIIWIYIRILNFVQRLAVGAPSLI